MKTRSWSPALFCSVIGGLLRRVGDVFGYRRASSASSVLLPACAFAALVGSTQMARAVVYNAGQGYPYATLSAVPWKTLKPGDLVNIHWQPQPYHEHILISTSGTQANHIVVRGIPDPISGQLPVLDGDNAVESPSLGYFTSSVWGLGIVMVSPNPTYIYGSKPSYIDIENLKVINARAPLKYTAPDGSVRSYGKFTCAVYIERGQHIAVRNCELTASGLGFFVNSKYDDKALSADILVENNYIHHNGVVGDYSCHNCYTECYGIVYQFNRIGPVIAGSYGDAIKDRSAGTVLRYNWIESGAADCLDLIEAQSDYPLITTLPNYDRTWVYGNTFYNGPTGASWMITYGGFDTNYNSYRRGTLYFYNNTVINQQDKSGPGGRWRSHLFSPPYRWLINQNSVERIDCRNNIIYAVAATPGQAPADFALMYTDNTGLLDLGVNYVSPGVLPYYYSGQGSFPGSVTGWGGQLFGGPNGINNPGFVDATAMDFRLANSSVCIDKGTAQAGAVAGVFDPLFEFLPTPSAYARPMLGVAVDLGAHEDSGLPQSNPLLGINSVAVPEGNSGLKNMVFTVTLTSPSAVPVSVGYATTDGTAKATKDYAATKGTLIIPAGQLTAVIAVPIIGNTLAEADKTFTVSLVNSIGATIVTAKGTGIIQNDDGSVGGGPIITGFTPQSGPIGTLVTIVGQGFTGATAIAIHDISAAYTVVSDTKLTMTIPVGATTAKIKVVTSKGTAWTATVFTLP